MAAGANDHPSSTTAMQVYKILSLTHTLMPPPSRYGNCSIDSSTLRVPSVISLKDITKIYKKKHDCTKLSKYEAMMKNINEVVRTDEFDVFDVIIDHDYDTDFEDKTILYFTAAKICKKLCETTPVKNCTLCKSSLLASAEINANAHELGLEDWELEIQPKKGFCDIINKLNVIFEKNRKAKNVAELVLLEAVEQKILVFPCGKHKKHVVQFMLQFFISLKMIKASGDINIQKKKEAMHQKKLAKHKGT